MRLRTILIYLAFSLALTHASYGQVTFGQSVPIVSALPATCTAVGSSSSSSSVQYQGTFYYCSATDTWTAYGSGGGGGGTPGGSSGQLQYNNAGAFAGVSGSSVSGSALTLGGALTVSISASPIATFTSSSSGAAPRVIVNSTGQANAGIELQESSVKKWSIATYSGGIFTFYNEALGAEAIGITSANVINLQGLTGVNKASPGGQLHTVSGSASRISGLFEAAASNSAAVLVSKSGSSGTGNLFEAQNSSGTVQMAVTPNGSLALTGIAFSALGSTNGVLVYCTDCAVTSGADNTCTSGGSGALAIRLNGVQRCFIAQN